ncbi:MAG: polysaccharide deacetylase family protein [Bacteroidota bacterium]
MGLKQFILRQVAAPVLHNSGWFRRTPRNSLPQKLILNYHGVLDREPLRINNRHLPVAQFEADLQYLKQHYEVVPLKEMFWPDSARRSERPWVALTFDDGYRNNLEFAVPLLAKYAVPATFYIVTAALEDPEFRLWADTLDIVLAHHQPTEIALAEQTFVRDPGGHYRSGDQTLWEAIKSMGMARDVWIEEFTAQFGDFSARVQQHQAQWKMMSGDEVRRCYDSGWVEIGSHTHRHYNLGRIPAALVQSELEQSRRILEDLIQDAVTGIGYPDGDYTEAVKDLAERAGYREQVAVGFRLPGDPQDPRIRRRFSYSNSTTHASNMIRMERKWTNYAFL